MKMLKKSDWFLLIFIIMILLFVLIEFYEIQWFLFLFVIVYTIYRLFNN